MERLLADATKLTGVKYDINNLSDVYEAIHAIQGNLDITGTTAKEAATTFSGSFGMMKAAAMNLLGYMADGSSQQYVAQALTDLLNSTSTFLFDNAIPMLGRFIEMVPGVIARGLNGLRTKLSEAGAEGIGGFISGFVREIPAVIEAVVRLAAEIVKYFIRNKDQFKQMAHECVVAFVEGLSEILPMSEETASKLPSIIENGVKGIALIKVASILQPFVSSFGGTILNTVTSAGNNMKTFFGLMKSGGGVFSNLGLMISQGTGPMASLAASFVNAGGGLKGFLALIKILGSSLVSAIFSPVTLVIGILAALGGAFMTLWQTNDDFRANMTETWNGLVENFQGFIQGVLDRINALGFDFQSFGELVSTVWNGFCEMLAPVFEGAWTAISGILSEALDVITGLLDFFIGLFSGNWSQLWTGCQEIASGVWNAICGVFQGVFDTIIGLLNWFCGLFGTDWQTVWTNCQNTASSIWNSITSTLSGIWNGLVSTAQSIFTSIKNAISQKFQEAKDKVVSIWNGAQSTLTGIWNGIVGAARSVFESVYDAIVGPFQRAKSTVEGIWNWLTGHSTVNVNVNQSGGGNHGTTAQPHAAGGVFTRATLLPSIYGSSHIVGEAGPEAILPLKEFYRSMDRSIQQGYQAASYNPQLDAVVELLSYIAEKPTNILMDKTVVGRMVSSEVESAINRRNSLNRRLAGGTV